MSKEGGGAVVVAIVNHDPHLPSRDAIRLGCTQRICLRYLGR